MMDRLTNILVILFFTISLAAIAIALLYLGRRLFGYYTFSKTVSAEVMQYSPSGRSREEYIKEALLELATNGTPDKAAKAFGRLLKEEYVLLHILQNKGNNYNEKKQVRIYRQSLTKQSIDALFGLEEHHGGHWL